MRNGAVHRRDARKQKLMHRMKRIAHAFAGCAPKRRWAEVWTATMLNCSHDNPCALSCSSMPSPVA